MLLMVILVSCYQYWHMGMMYDVITDAAKECATDFTHASRASYYKPTTFLISYLTDDFTRIPADWLHFSSNLCEKKKKKKKKQNKLSIKPDKPQREKKMSSLQIETIPAWKISSSEHKFFLQGMGCSWEDLMAERFQPVLKERHLL